MRRRSPDQPTEWRSLLVLAIIAVWLAVSHQRAQATGRTPLQERAAQAVLTPVQRAVSVGYQQTALTLGALGRSRRLLQENHELRRKNTELETKVLQRQIEVLEAQEMIEAYGFPPGREPERIPAYVVGRSPGSFVRQTIDLVAAGGRELRTDDVVVWNDRLVGRVERAQGGRARAVILLDPRSGAAAIVKPSNAQGSILGPEPASRDPHLLRLVRLQPNAAIAVGDKVFTSRIGETYPSGILIGVIEEVVGGVGPEEPKTGLVKPYADFGNLTYVSVLRRG